MDSSTPTPATPSLAPHHRQMLEDSAIAESVISARGYWIATRKVDLAHLGFVPAQQLPPALVVPLWSVHGEVGTYTIRPDTPRMRQDRSVKYEFIRGSRMLLDVPPTPANRQQLGNPTVPLWVTEGAKKADSLVSHGCCAVEVHGTWAWRGTNPDGGKTALADWELVALNERTIYLVFDSDIMEKRSVYKALERLGAFLGTSLPRCATSISPVARVAARWGSMITSRQAIQLMRSWHWPHRP